MLTISNSADFIRVRDFHGTPVARAQTSPVVTAPTVDWEATTSARLSVARIVRSAQRLSELLDSRLAGGAGPETLAPIAHSGVALGLAATSTSARVTGTEEVNATPTSFSPRAPQWSGLTSMTLTVGGVYDGSRGTVTLEFRVGAGGIRGVSPVRIDVYDGATLLDSVDVGATDPESTVYTLASGLTFTLGSGTAVLGDSAAVEVFHDLGSVVDPDAAFDGTGDDHPGLQEGFAVTAGSFEVNGENIDVAGDDSINSVLAAINLSAAGVTATFDAASERIGIVHDTPGSGPSIVLGNDTSGFLAAAKLADATTVPGSSPDRQKVLASVARFAAVSSGTVSVNGQDVVIDVDVDSLDDIVTRLDAAGADSTAAISADSQRVTIAPIASAGGTTVELDEGTTGLFTALAITPGRYGRSGGSGNGFPAHTASRALDAVQDLSTSLERLFSARVDSVSGVADLRAAVRSLIGEAVASAGIEPRRFGLRALERPLAPLEVVERPTLARALRQRARPLRELFGAVDQRTGGGGLLGNLHTLLLAHHRSLGIGNAASPVGSLVDRFA